MISQGYDLEWSGSDEIAAGKALKRSFEFRPNGSDVGKPIAVKQLRATIGRSGCFRAAISMTCKRDEELEARERQFFVPAFKQVGIPNLSASFLFPIVIYTYQPIGISERKLYVSPSRYRWTTAM